MRIIQKLYGWTTDLKFPVVETLWQLHTLIIPCTSMRSKGKSKRFANLQSVSQSVCLSVCGHKNEHFERIRNACGFLLQQMSSKW